MIIVSNTTPLIAFSSLQRFELLQQLFSKIYIAQAVYDESVAAHKNTDNLKTDLLKATWIEIVKIKDRLAVDVLLDEFVKTSNNI